MCVGAKSYTQCLVEAFQLLAERGGRALQDPVGISGLIPAANTDSKRSQLATAVRNAAFHAIRAWEAEAGRNTPEAVRQWDIVFNGHFPKA